MTFTYSTKLMAQALAIVAEAGIHGMEYNGLLEKWGDTVYQRQSKKFRVSPVSAHRFTGAEFEDFMILAWRFGFVERSSYCEVEWKAEVNKSAYDLEDEIVRLTKEGWEYIEQYDQPLLHKAGRKLSEEWPTILLSVIAALVSSWVLFEWGAP